MASTNDPRLLRYVIGPTGCEDQSLNEAKAIVAVIDDFTDQILGKLEEWEMAAADHRNAA